MFVNGSNFDFISFCLFIFLWTGYETRCPLHRERLFIFNFAFVAFTSGRQFMMQSERERDIIWLQLAFDYLKEDAIDIWILFYPIFV